MKRHDRYSALIRAVEKSVTKDRQRQRISMCASMSIHDVMLDIHSSLKGLDDRAVVESRNRYGEYIVTREPK